eukprot:s2886_g2.t1
MNASIPGRYGFRRKSEQRSAALARAWTEVHELVEQQLSIESPALQLPWDTFPEGLDPAAGELDPQRAMRKRAQVQSLAAFALEMMKPGTKAGIGGFLSRPPKTKEDIRNKIGLLPRPKKITACAMGGGKGPPRDWEESRRKGKGSGGWKGDGKWWPDEEKGRGKDGKSKGSKGRETSKPDWQQWVPKDRAQEKWKGGKDRSEEERAIRSQLSSNAPDFQPSGLYDFQSYGVPPPPPPPWHFEMPALWQEFADAEGTKYYYNAKTGLTQWDRPAELEPPTRPEPPAPRAERRREEKREVKRDEPREGHDKGDGKGKKRRSKPVSEKEKEPSFGPPGCNLFVFHLPDDWTDEDLLEYFAPHGNVVSAKVMKELGTGRSRGFGFVSCLEREGAIPGKREEEVEDGSVRKTV